MLPSCPAVACTNDKGVVYGANQNAVLVALNAFFFEVGGGGEPTGYYYKSHNNPFSPTTFTPTTGVTLANQIRFNPLIIEEDLEITGFSVNFTAGVVGAIEC